MAEIFSSDTFHTDSPPLGVDIYLDDDGIGTVNYRGRVSSTGFYRYHLRFYATNNSDLDSADFSSMKEIAAYDSPDGEADTTTGEIDFDVSEWCNETVYFWYGCYYHNVSDSNINSPSDSSFLVSHYVDHTQKPEMGELYNDNKYVDSDGVTHADVSASTNSITIRSAQTGGSYRDTWHTYINGPGRSDTYSYTDGDYFSGPYDVFHNLAPRTTYTLKAYMSNSAGDSCDNPWDDAPTLTIRTRSEAPVLAFNSEAPETHTLNSVTFNWVSTLSLKTIYYHMKIDPNSNWGPDVSQVISNQSSGSITLNQIEPNTTVYIEIWGVEDFDGIVSEKIYGQSTTFNFGMANIQSDIIHNNGNMTIDVNNPSGNNIVFQILDGDTVIHEQPLNRDAYGYYPNTFSLTEDEWDTIYKRYGNDNSKVYTVRIVTDADPGHNTSKYYAADTRTITLTGIQKTAHIGHDGPKRAMVYMGGENNSIKRAVVWVGNSGPKRTI